MLQHTQNLVELKLAVHECKRTRQPWPVAYVFQHLIVVFQLPDLKSRLGRLKFMPKFYKNFVTNDKLRK